MTTLLVDLGTSRTSIGAKGANSEWLDWKINARVPQARGVDLGDISLLIESLASVQPKKGKGFGYLQTTTSFISIGNGPAEVAALVALQGPNTTKLPGLRIEPDAHSLEFVSVKDDKERLSKYVKLLEQIMVGSFGNKVEWVFGKSAGARVSPCETLPTASCVNEAVAVLFASITGSVNDFVSSPPDFIIVADLGGGFLDVTVADQVEFGERASARVVNFGGYPIGVDRVDRGSRFGTGYIAKTDEFLDLVGLCVAYHVWDYLERAKPSTEAPSGLLVLTGGGMRRIPDVVRERLRDNRGAKLLLAKIKKFVSKLSRSVNLDVIAPIEDTKYLTLAGLSRVRDQEFGDLILDISSLNPLNNGRVVLSAAGRPAGTVESWANLMDEARNALYP